MAKTKDWRQVVKDADPDLDERPYVYKFSNGKKIKEKANPYVNNPTPPAE